MTTAHDLHIEACRAAVAEAQGELKLAQYREAAARAMLDEATRRREKAERRLDAREATLRAATLAADEADDEEAPLDFAGDRPVDGARPAKFNATPERDPEEARALAAVDRAPYRAEALSLATEARCFGFCRAADCAACRERGAEDARRFQASQERSNAVASFCHCHPGRPMAGCPNPNCQTDTSGREVRHGSGRVKI